MLHYLRIKCDPSSCYYHGNEYLIHDVNSSYSYRTAAILILDERSYLLYQIFICDIHFFTET